MGKLLLIHLVGHPEQRKGEMFLGYKDKHGISLLKCFSNLRKGIAVYNKEGRYTDQSKIREEYQLYPVFVPSVDFNAVRNALFYEPSKLMNTVTSLR